MDIEPFIVRAVQMIAALQAGLDYVVTRNPRDFGSSLVPALQPVELVKITRHQNDLKHNPTVSYT